MSNFGEITILINIKKLFLPKIFLIFKQLKEKSSFSNYFISILRRISSKICIYKATRIFIVMIISQFRTCQIGTKCPKLIVMSSIYPCTVRIFLEQLLPSSENVFCCIHRKQILICFIDKIEFVNFSLCKFYHNFIVA